MRACGVHCDTCAPGQVVEASGSAKWVRGPPDRAARTTMMAGKQHGTHTACSKRHAACGIRGTPLVPYAAHPLWHGLYGVRLAAQEPCTHALGAYHAAAAMCRPNFRKAPIELPQRTTPAAAALRPSSRRALTTSTASCAWRARRTGRATPRGRLSWQRRQWSRQGRARTMQMRPWCS